MAFFVNFLDSLYSVALPALFVFTFVVFFHELGHFLVARWNGVHVEVFSIGFGRKIFGFIDKKGTSWQLSWIPLGGYCKICGMGSEKSDDFERLNAKRKKQIRDQDMFYDHKSVWSRMSIASAGPIANFILAILIFWSLFFLFGVRTASTEIYEVTPSSPAALAGLREGDVIDGINEKKITSPLDVQKIVTLNAGEALTFDITRNGRSERLLITPRLDEIIDRFGNRHQGGVLGVRLKEGADMAVNFFDPFTSLFLATARVWEIGGMTLSYMGQLVIGKQDSSNLAGPIRIVQISAQSASEGFLTLFSVIAILSISLGLINLFPLPLLDGGHILFYLIEAVKGSPLSLMVQEYLARMSLVLLLGLMIFVTFNDISHLGFFSNKDSG